MARSMLPLPFPKEAVRDLLGITRALYRAEVSSATPDRGRLERLQQIGQLYRDALEMGLRCAPESLGRRSALAHAERATEQLGSFVAESELLGPAVEATAAWMRRRVL